MVLYCPDCLTGIMKYDHTSNEFYCIECELVIPAKLRVDKSLGFCYTQGRPRSRRTPVRLRKAVVRN